MLEFLVPIIEVVLKIGELLVEPIVGQCKHLVHPNKSINNLEKELVQLSDMRKALQGQVNADRNNGRKIAPDVEKCLIQVKDIEAELQQLFEQEEINKKNQYCRYSLSKRAAKMRVDVESLRDKMQNFRIVSYPPSPPQARDMFPGKIKGLQSRTKIIMEVIEKLKDDEFQRISVCGMGGVGKTTLVIEVMLLAEANKVFDKVAFAVVSENVEDWKIQGDIAGMLGLEFGNETPQGRAGKLLKRLKDINKVLIVLDDIWTERDFERIGIPSGVEYHKGCKILFTSRDEHLCDKMGSQKNFTIPALSGDEAWELFREMADICDKRNIYPIAEEVANECGGLPIAIVTIGKMLVNKKKHAWENALHQLKASPYTSFSEMQRFVYTRIELSYNFLSVEEQRDCLLLCCLFPEDFDIPIEVLMRHGLGLGVFKDVDELWKVRNQVHDLVDNLRSCSLLLDSEKEECVKMHDVVRETIIWIASKRHECKLQGSVEIERPKGGTSNYKAISLMLDKVTKPSIELNYSNYQLLQVETMEEKTIPWPKTSLHDMCNLKVFGLRNLCIPKSSLLFRALHNIWILRLENCELGDISIIGTELTKLEILSFVSSNIKQLPIEIGQLGSLRLLDLRRCNYLYRIHSDVLARLSRLEELYIGVNNFPWHQNNAILAELKYLSHQLRVFEVSVQKVEFLPQDLVFENLERFWVYVGHSLGDVFHHGYLQSNILHMKAVDCNSIHDSSLMKQLVKNCVMLHLEKVKNLNTIHDLCEREFSDLIYLCVKSCNDLEFLIDKKPAIEFSELIKLELEDLPKLIGFVKAMVSDELKRSIPSVDELKGNEIVEDEEISFGGELFSCDWMQRFPKLEKIFLTGCSSLSMVFDLQNYSDLVGQGNPLLFPQVREMRIERLYNLRHVWGHVPHNVQGFKNLRSLSISSCDSLRYVFTPSIVRALTQLGKMEVSDCDSMEELVSTGIENNGDDEKKNAKIVEFAKLVSIELTNLPRLMSFCSDSDFELIWPSLRHLTIEKCSKQNVNQIQKVIESAKQDNPVVSSNIDCSTITSSKGPMRFFRCFGYANKSSIKASSPKDPSVPSMEETEISLRSPMPILQHIRIWDCNSMDAIFNHSMRINVNSFSGVESVNLYDVPNLVSFCHQTRDSPSFHNDNVIMGAFNEGEIRIRRVPFIDGFLLPNITSLEIWGCHKINSLFSLSSSRSLECLKELKIIDCDNIEEIVLGDEETQTSNIVFPGLRLLGLRGLRNFRSFCSSSHHLEFLSLEEISISDCPKMEELLCGFSNPPKLQDVTISNERCTIKYMHRRDLNAIIRQYKALNVALQTSETSILFVGMHMFDHLKELFVSKCPSLEEVFGWEGILDLDMKKEYELEEMNLKNLPKLKCIWRSSIIKVVSFPNLRKLRISQCDNLKSVLSLSVAQNFVHLEYLSVEECNKIEKIVIQNDDEIEGVNEKVKIKFPELKELYLRDLPNLRCFCSAAYDIELPSCHKMMIAKCPNITTFSHGTVSTPQLPEIFLDVEFRGRTFYRPIPTRPTPTMGDLNSTIKYFQKAGVFEEQMQESETFGLIERNEDLLGYITRVRAPDLIGYENLLICVPSHMMHRFQHLKELRVKECDSVVEIFESKVANANNEEDGVMLYELQRMSLHSLPKLASIWKSYHSLILGFQNLGYFEVSSCHSLKSVFPLSIAKCLPQLTSLRVRDCPMMEEIVAFTIDEGNKISQEPNETRVLTFPSLYELDLEDLPSLNRFCPGPCDFVLPDCRRIAIKNCKKMESFCLGIIFTPSVWCLYVEETEYDPEEGLDAIIRRQYKAQNASKIEDHLGPTI